MKKIYNTHEIHLENNSKVLTHQCKRKAYEIDLLNEKININKYNSLLKTISAVNLTYNNDRFICMDTGLSADEIAGIYSRAKHGSIKDINKLALMISDKFINEVSKETSCLGQHFRKCQSDEINVLITPGLRNVPSAANLIYKAAIKSINVYLARNCFKTIINVSLPRLDEPVYNYAILSHEEREEISRTRDHVLPSNEFYTGRKIHIFFGDDVLITGATNDKVIQSALDHGVISFHSLFAVVLDPKVTKFNPEVEQLLNHFDICSKITDTFIEIINEHDFTPVMKTFSIILDKKNKKQLYKSLHKIKTNALHKIFTNALSNDFHNNPDYKESLAIIGEFLDDSQRID